MNENLKSHDIILHNLIENEFLRQKKGLELIASENLTSRSVMECLGSILTNKYSEGLPGKRYYGGCEIIDKIEVLCQQRALNAFNLDNSWHVNVQSYSGSIANFAVYTALLNPGDKLMGLDLPSGGHLTHGYQTDRKKISASALYFESQCYKVNAQGFIDYDELEKQVREFKPKLIICGASSYPRDFDYKRFRDIANINNSFLMCDMSHITGFIATGEMNNPFEYCDVITTTTHKTLRGPRSALIFSNKDLIKKIDSAVFPMLQGGPHQHQIAAVATQLLEVKSEDFKTYIKQVRKNTHTMCEYFKSKGYNLSTNGSDNHLLLLNLKNKNITGSKIEYLCNMVDISINKNAVPGDTSALSPGGIRIGTSALTTRGFKEQDILIVAEILHDIIEFATEIQHTAKYKKLNDFSLNCNYYLCEIQFIKNKVNSLAIKYDFIDL